MMITRVDVERLLLEKNAILTSLYRQEMRERSMNWRRAINGGERG